MGSLCDFLGVVSLPYLLAYIPVKDCVFICTLLKLDIYMFTYQSAWLRCVGFVPKALPVTLKGLKAPAREQQL